MMAETGVVPGRQNYRVRSHAERERAFQSAARHSRQVDILRKALPVLAVVVFAGYFISSRLSMTVGGITASIDGVKVENGNLRMVNPKLKGMDKKNGTYVIGAEYADQDVKTPKILQLHAIKAELNNASGGWSRVAAVRGTYDSDAERLIMRDAIHVITSSDVTGKLKIATLDTQNQTLRSHAPVGFDLPNGTVRANALTFHSADHTLLFRGHVLVHINQAEKPATATAHPPSAAGEPAPTPPLVLAPSAPAGAPPEPAAAAEAVTVPEMPQ
ncbi:MAG: LPS export ABC transporter periplasmic protein LptC [Methyloceanibacter sp.]